MSHEDAQWTPERINYERSFRLHRMADALRPICQTLLSAAHEMGLDSRPFAKVLGTMSFIDADHGPTGDDWNEADLTVIQLHTIACDNGAAGIAEAPRTRRRISDEQRQKCAAALAELQSKHSTVSIETIAKKVLASAAGVHNQVAGSWIDEQRALLSSSGTNGTNGTVMN